MADQPLFPNLDKGAVASLNGTHVKTPVPDLFGESNTPKQTASANSSMVNAVVSTSEAHREQILGPKPTINAGYEVGSHSRAWGNLIFRASVLLAVVTMVFFYSQLNTRFSVLGKNPAQTLASLEANIQEEKTTINLYNFMIAKFALDDFSVLADKYLYLNAQYESDYTSKNKKAELKADLDTLQEDIKGSLSTIQNKLKEPLYPKDFSYSSLSIVELEQQYVDLLTARVDQEKQEVLTQNSEGDSLEIANLDSVVTLMNDTEFDRQITVLNLQEDLSKETIDALFQKTTQINKSEFLTILNIKNARVDWSEVLNELDAVTGEVDPLYGSGIPNYINYSSISLDAEEQTVLLRGTTRTDDSLNFSVISDLIDELEASTLFSEVSSRTFAKSPEENEDYTASFSISLSLQSGEDPRDEVTPVAVEPVAEERVTAEEVAPEEEAAEEESEEAVTEESEEATPPTEPETTEEPAASPLAMNAVRLFDILKDFVQGAVQADLQPPRVTRTP